MKKRRVTLRIENDEAAVVAPITFWQGLEDHFKAMQDEAPSEYSQGWLDAMHHIQEWVEKTKDKRSLSEDDE